MKTLTKTANSISQTGSVMQVPFIQLNNLKNTNHKSYAYSKTPIQGGLNNGRGPYLVRCKDFRFNIPSNSIVKKITIHYRHSKRATCGDRPGEYVPCALSSTKKRCNIPAPTFTLLNIGVTGKGQAPANNPSNLVKSFTGLWDASSINSSNFGVEINYPLNTNNYTGFVLLSNLYLSIEYDSPAFSADVNGRNEVYNHDTYNLNVYLGDANLTGKTTSVTISVPLGFTYTGVVGSSKGTVEQVSARTLRWTPVMWGSAESILGQSPSGNRVVLGFSVDVSFSGDSSVLPCSFTVGLPDSSSVSSFTVNVRKELPVQDETAQDTPAPIDEEEETVAIEWEKVTVNANISLNITPDELSKYSTRTIHIFPVNKDRESQFLGQDTRAYIRTKYDTGLIEDQRYDKYITSRYYGWVNNEDAQVSEQFVRFTEVGLYCVLFYGGFNVSRNPSYSGNKQSVQQGTGEFYKFSYFMVIPNESSLTTPFMSILEPSEEECNRLGDGYNYILQSNLKLTSQEEYVRDWYRNFRIGVFNNKISANCSTYYLQASTGTSLTGEIRLSSRHDITDGYMRLGLLSSNMMVTIDGRTITMMSHHFIRVNLFGEYIFPVIFSKYGYDNVKLTIEQYTSDGTLVDTFDYRIQFNAEEDIPLREVEEDSTDYTQLTQEEIFTNAKYWADNTAGLNTFNNVNCEFTYDKNYPLYLIITGDYPEGAPSDNPVTYNEPCIIEETDYTERKPNGNYPAPIDDLVSLDNVTSETQIPMFTQTETIVFYDLPLDNHYGTNTEMAIRGIELTGNIEQSDRLVLYANLKAPTGESRQRSLIINDYQSTPETVNEFHIGGMGDLWGFSTLDMIDLEQWEAELTISNTLEGTDSSINFGSIRLILYVEPVTAQNNKVYVEGEDLAYYNAFITDIIVPEGLETETDYLKVDGTDTNDAYRQNVKEKTITIEFDIGESCNLEENTLSLRELTKLLVNDRDEYNRPIPKRLELSHYPDVYWEYIMEEALDTEIDISTYHCKAKLTIPAGTSYDKVNTTTAGTGYINGIATINPLILVKPTSENISITEENTGQKFHIGYSGEWTDKIIEIDCENRICWLKQNEDDDDPINLNGYVDYNSDWFRLKGEYHFTSTGGVVMTVDYAERW